ncbi:uncharacterized protein LOC132745936 [Ruditapes philippinarum]|uniref:uncharacterized protein LOC132745936 n=1 Tax=Ruditapes philippinarum TaxID=129788 RepID=UPI00295BE364|nr:uncharacterized protein LOC132745936 [Ruditapes philippinarum]XP_060590937.1 uncharacterized protein LOC132745936 [Ruditapes philippinarum]
MGAHFAKIDQTFLTACQSQLCQLDELLLGHVLSVDALQDTFSQLLHQLNELNTESNDGNHLHSKQKLGTSIELTKKILSNIQNAFGHNTTSLLQGISQFARIIKTNSTKANPITKTVARLNELKIDAFLSRKNPELSDVSKPDEKTNGQHNDRAQTEKMKKESEHDIAKLKEEKNKISKDLQKINDDNEANKKIIEECKEIMTKLREENDQLLKDKEDMKNKITKLERDSVQIAPVQLFCQKRNDQVGFVIQEIVAQLNAKGKFGAKKLAFITCENSTDILPALPLLVLCINASRIGTDAAKSIEGITKPQNSALIVLHYKDEHALPEQSSDRVLGEPEFKSLAGIFDIGFQSGKGIYNCDRNTNAVTGLVQFIQQILEENPLKVHVQ